MELLRSFSNFGLSLVRFSCVFKVRSGRLGEGMGFMDLEVER